MSEKELALKITEILKENLDDDYEMLERPDYDAMLYALRDAKDFLEQVINK